MTPRTFTLVGLAVAMLCTSDVAHASWKPSGSGASFSRAQALLAGNQPTVGIANRSATVTWPATGGPVPVEGYKVSRYGPNNQRETVGGGCAGTLSETSCTETGVPSGTWTYTVTPVRGAWRGAEGPQSSPATVASPALTLDPQTVNSLPTNLTGGLQHFVDGQTVSFRLDDPSNGLTLSGSTSPSPVPENGTTDISVTVPSDVADGSHTVYAIGNQGDVASAPFTINTSCSAPGDQVVSANRDSYVDSTSSSSNFGTATQLFARPAQALLLSQRMSLVGFDLPSIPARCTLTGASLRLYATSAGDGRTIEVSMLSASWTEASVTWNNRPSSTGVVSSSTSLSAPGWQSWGVLPQVEAMYSGTNHGFLVKDSANSALLSVQQAYQSRQGAPDLQDPQLVLTFE